MPKIPGIADFKGRVIHSKYFKNSDEFRGQDVVCVGFGPSVADLALHLSNVANQVTVCHKFPYGLKLGMLPQDVRELQNVKMVTTNGVITEQDERVACDAIILCTGLLTHASKFINDYSSQDIAIKNITRIFLPLKFFCTTWHFRIRHKISFS